MLTNTVTNENLEDVKQKLKDYIPEEAKEYFIDNNTETTINFPVLQYPEKVKSLNLDKTPFYSGKIKGIKGQYIIFEDQTVFNIRNWEGYKVSIKID